MKKIYFVRHGESEGNIGPVQQDHTSPLTQKGKEQAHSVAKRLAGVSVGVIVSSNMLRAKETAEVVAGVTNAPVEHSDFFAERRKPSLMYGKSKDDTESVDAYKTVVANFHLPGFRHSDEENFDDLKDRAKNAMAYLASRPEETIVVVTHGYFMRIIMAYALFGDSLTGEECSRCARFFHMENTGITILEHTEKKENPWWLWVWNDHVHLT